MGLNLAGGFGSLFGYGTGGQTAADQLAQEGVQGPAQLNTGEEEQNAADQAAILAQLRGEAAGTGPSAAQTQLSAGTQQAIDAEQAAGAGGRYGQNAALRQRSAEANAASLEGGASNTAAQLRAREQQEGISGSAALSGNMRGQSLQSAAANMQGQEMYNQQLAGLYGQEQGQQAQAGMNLQGSAMNAIGGGLSALAAAKHGAVTDGGTRTEVGERGPEILLPAGHKGRAVLITHPMLIELGRRGRDVVLPLEEGSATYRSGPMKMEGRPTTPAPIRPRIKPEALRALMGAGPPRSPGPGARALSPATAPIVEFALRSHGMDRAANGIVSHGPPHLVGRMHPGAGVPRLSPRLIPHMEDGGIAGILPQVGSFVPAVPAPNSSSGGSGGSDKSGGGASIASLAKLAAAANGAVVPTIHPAALKLLRLRRARMHATGR